MGIRKYEDCVIVTAPAKVNLVLEIKGTDDEGYHQLATIFQTVEMFDAVTVRLSSQDKLKIVDVTRGGFPVAADHNNLVCKAQRLLEQHCQRRLPCSIVLLKTIPAGGGLGGGSADAAATLIALNELYELRIPHSEMMQLGAQLGADVSFGLVRGTALGEGRGDKLSRLACKLSGRLVVFVMPKRGLSTPEVYKRWDNLPDEQRHPARGQAQRFVDLLQNDATQEQLLECLSNDLEAPSFAMYHKLSVIRRKLLENGCVASLMCGSGSTMMGILPEQVSKEDVERIMSKMASFGKVVLSAMCDSDLQEE